MTNFYQENFKQVYLDKELDIKVGFGDTIQISCVQQPESKITLMHDSQEGWNLYRRGLFLINIPYSLDVTSTDAEKEISDEQT